MKIKNITETTVAGGIAPVAAPMGKAIKRESVKVSGQEPVSKLLKKGGKMKRKGPYMNSPVLEGIQEGNKSDKLTPEQKKLIAKYKKTKDPKDKVSAAKAGIKPSELKEASLSEEDVILVPGQSPRLRAGFHAHDPDKADHELETVKNSLKTIMRNAQELYSHLESSTQFPEWVSEKIGQIKGMMTSVSDYMVSKQMPMSEEQGFNDHEISMARSEMRSAVKSAKKIYELLGQRQNIMAWQQSYITLASDYLDSVADSMEQESADGVNEMTGGVIAAGGVGEGVEQQNLNLATPKYTNQYDMSLFDNPQRFWLKVHDWIDGVYLGDKKLRRELPGYIRWILNYSDMGKDKSKEQMGVYGVMNDIKKKWPETYGNLKYENKAKTLRMDIQTIVELFLNGTIR
jgi:phage anti-repressor protein